MHILTDYFRQFKETSRPIQAEVGLKYTKETSKK